MADIFDMASERETLERELAIKAALTTSRTGAIKPKGACHNCGETLEHAHNLFCDADCGNDYQRRMANRRI